MAEEEQKEKPEQKDEEKGQPKEEKGKSPSGTGTAIIVGIGLLVMLITPLTSYFVVKSITPSAVIESQPEIKKGKVEETIIDMDTIRVNIRETKGTRFLALKCHLVLSEAQLSDVLAGSKSMLMDKISLVASRRTLNELEGPEARLSMKKDIMAEINAAIESRMSGAITDVYFSEFLIQ